MGLALAVEIWLGVAVVLGLAICVHSGRIGHDDPAGGVVCAVMWPFLLAITLVAGPFWLAYKLGKLLP